MVCKLILRISIRAIEQHVLSPIPWRDIKILLSYKAHSNARAAKRKGSFVTISKIIHKKVARIKSQRETFGKGALK